MARYQVTGLTLGYADGTRIELPEHEIIIPSLGYSAQDERDAKNEIIRGLYDAAGSVGIPKDGGKYSGRWTKGRNYEEECSNSSYDYYQNNWTGGEY